MPEDPVEPLPRLAFGLFGGVTAWRDGVEVELGGAKQRAVLALLLLEPGRVVPLPRIVDAVWGDHPPARAEVSLRGYVSNLRKALGQGPGLIAWRDGGYVVHAEPGAVDLDRFDAAVTAGQAALAAGRPAEARVTLADALALWTGPPGGALADDLPIGAVVARLEARRADAADALADARLALGQHDTLVGDLVVAVAAQPLNERRRAQLALALYRSGRAVDALRAIEDARRTLAEDVGVDPGPELRTLEAAILAHDPALAWAEPPAPAEPGPSRRGGGAGPGPGAPALTVGARATPFVGREREVAAVGAAARPGSVVVVSGEAGIGKTSLVAAALGDSPAVAWGRCPEAAATSPYRPWIALAAQLAKDAATAEAGRGLRAAVADGVDAGGAPLVGRLGVHAAVVAALRRLERPVVVVVDDLQWADEASLALVELLAGDVADLPVALVVTLRTPLADPPPALVDALGELARAPAVHRLELGGLSPSALGEWIDRAVGDAAEPGFAAFVHDRTGGNPFFARELLALLAAEDRLAVPGPGSAAPVLPAAVQDVVRRRTSRLPAATQPVLRAAAVVGRAFDADLVAHVLDAAVDDVLDALVPALDAGLVAVDAERPGRFSFSHALVGETLLAEQNPVRRARAHAAVARAIERLRPAGALVAERAHHAYAGASAGTAALAVDHCTRAAERAAAAFAPAEAAVHLDHALHALDRSDPADGARRHALLVALGRARGRDGDVAGGRAALVEAAALAETLGDVAATVAAVAQVNVDDLWSSLDWAESDPRSVGLLERALVALGPDDSAERAQALAALAGELYYGADADRSDALSAEAVAMATRVGDPQVLSRVLLQRYWATWRADGLAARAEASAALVELAGAGHLAEAFVPVAHLARFAAAYEQGDAAVVDRALSAARAGADPVRTPSAWTYVQYAEVSLHLLRGDFAAASAAIGPLGTSFRRTRRFVAETTTAALRAQVHGERGEPDAAVAELEIFRGTAYDPSMGWMRAWAWAEAGEGDAAARELASFDGPLPDDWYRIVLLTLGVHAAATVGDHAFLRRHAPALRPLAGRIACAGSGGVVLGPVSLALARADLALGDESAAAVHLAIALDQAERLGAEPWIARALAVRAEVDGDPADRVAARQRAAAIGMAGLVARLS